MAFSPLRSDQNNGSAVPRTVQNPWVHQAELENFCSKLTSVNSRAVVSAVCEIVSLRQQMVVNILAVGERLSELRASLGPVQFSFFMRTILPRLGISRSTGYRWLGLAEKLP